MIKNLGWWVLGIAAALVALYLLLRKDDGPIFGTRTTGGGSLVSTVAGLFGAVSKAISGSDTSTAGGFRFNRGDGATSSDDGGYSIDYGGGELSPEEEAAARDFAAEL